MLIFLSASDSVQWDQKAHLPIQIPWLNINHFLFLLFHKSIPHWDDEAVLKF